MQDKLRPRLITELKTKASFSRTTQKPFPRRASLCCYPYILLNPSDFRLAPCFVLRQRQSKQDNSQLGK